MAMKIANDKFKSQLLVQYMIQLADKKPKERAMKKKKNKKWKKKTSTMSDSSMSGVEPEPSQQGEEVEPPQHAETPDFIPIGDDSSLETLLGSYDFPFDASLLRSPPVEPVGYKCRYFDEDDGSVTVIIDDGDDTQ
jgi:hypothetical protein